MTTRKNSPKSGGGSTNKPANRLVAHRVESSSRSYRESFRVPFLRRKSADRLGNRGRLSTSNSLLSCTGSLLSDPFTPAALASLSDPSASSADSSSFALLQAQTIRSGHPQKQPRLSDDSDDSDESSDSSNSDGEGEAASGDDDDGVGTGIPLHQGAPSKTEDPTKSDDESSSDDDSSSSSSESEASSRSPSPEPVPEKKGTKTKAEKKGKPPAVGASKVDTKVVEEEVGEKKDAGKRKEKKRKEVGSPDKGVERKSKKSRKA